MHVLFLCVFVLLEHGFTGAEPHAPCPAQCDPARLDGCELCAPGKEGSPCGRRRDPPCAQGLECVRPGEKKYAKGVCRCKSSYPVCGSDGKRYANLCRMQTASRKAQHRGLARITQAHKDRCAPAASGGISTGQTHPISPRFKFNFIADVVEKIAPAVVHIELFISHLLFGHHVPLSSGSGFIVKESGVIVTNAHVVSSNTATVGRQQLRVELHDGKTYEASITAIDQKSDIATIKINPRKNLAVLPLGRSADLRPGEFVVAIGSPFALQNTVTTGIVSTAQRDGKELGIHDSDMDYVQTDAIINYGNSGGPLVNLDGEVIGINTLKVTAGISFAIPSDRIQRFLEESYDEQYESTHRLVRLQYTPPQPAVSDSEVTATRKRFLGVRMIALTKSLIEDLKHHNSYFPDIISGLFIQEVIPGSPAQAVGLKTGDVIVKLNSRPLYSANDLQLAPREDPSLLLEVHRGKERLLFNIEPGIMQ